MPVLSLNKPIDLKIIKKKTESIFEKRKIIIPMLFSITGIFIGSVLAKGEGGVYLRITQAYDSLFNNTKENINLFFNSLIVPTILFFLEFLLGLSISGVFLLNLVPALYGFIIGEISHYYYTTYSLKGLAYCVMIIFPYTAITMLSIILNSKSNYNMSQSLSTFITRKQPSNNMLIKSYCFELLKNYVIIVIGVLINLLCHHFFSSFFSF